MTEAVSIPSPGLARTGRAVTLARVLWWLALLSIVLGAFRIAATYTVLSITFDEPAHIAAGHAAARQGQVHLRAAAPAAGAGGGGARPVPRRLPFAERRRHVDRGPPRFSMVRAIGPTPNCWLWRGSACCRFLWPRSSWSGCGPAAMSGRSRRRWPSSCSRICRCFSPIPGSRRRMRRLPRRLTAAFFSFLLWLERPSPVRGLLARHDRRAGALHQAVRPTVPARCWHRRHPLSLGMRRAELAADRALLAVAPRHRAARPPPSSRSG